MVVVSLKMRLCPYKAMLCPRLAVTQPSASLFQQTQGFKCAWGLGLGLAFFEGGGKNTPCSLFLPFFTALHAGPPSSHDSMPHVSAFPRKAPLFLPSAAFPSLLTGGLKAGPWPCTIHGLHTQHPPQGTGAYPHPPNAPFPATGLCFYTHTHTPPSHLCNLGMLRADVGETHG